MDQDPIVEAYDQWHREMQESGEPASPLAFPWYRSVYNAIEQEFSGDVLEVGCGRGAFAIWLSRVRPGARLIGLDFSEAAIQIAKESAQSQEVAVEFVKGDAEALPFPDESFDLVISCECMEHVRNPRRMAREIARITRQGGRFCLTTPNQLNGVLIAWLKSWLTRQPYSSGAGVQPRENFFFFWMVRRYLRDAGLVVERMESCHYQWLLLPRVDPAKLCTIQFSSTWARRLAFPFGLHFSFFGRKRDSLI